jgi:hypothetical protein
VVQRPIEVVSRGFECEKPDSGFQSIADGQCAAA